MIIWLDNQDNHKDAINENYGRELLELFSMGVGNYTEDDVKECARAFTGWTIANREYMEMRSIRDSDWPYGRIAWHFEFHPEDHDFGEKTFLERRATGTARDIVDIICKQPATARFIARHLYSFFVADEPPVPEWPYTEPRDPEAIETLVRAYFDNDYNIGAVLRVLFNSEFFKSEDVRYTKVKSPVELVAGVLRLTGEFDRPRYEILERYNQSSYMGQILNNPPASRAGTRAPTGSTAVRWWSASTSPANRSAIAASRASGPWLGESARSSARPPRRSGWWMPALRRWGRWPSTRTPGGPGGLLRPGRPGGQHRPRPHRRRAPDGWGDPGVPALVMTGMTGMEISR